MRPTFRLLANGSDITHLLSDRLLSLVLTDKPGLESDTFELVLDDRDGAIALPARGAWLDLFLGYAGEELAPMGRYRVDALRFDGPPRRLTLSGRAGDMHGEGKSTRCAAWENASLARIVFDLAARNHWSARCPVQVNVARAEQLNESDFNFITRLARQHDCTAKLADGLLLVLPRQAGESASGRAIAPLELMPGDVGSFDLREEGVRVAATDLRRFGEETPALTRARARRGSSPAAGFFFGPAMDLSRTPHVFGNGMSDPRFSLLPRRSNARCVN